MFAFIAYTRGSKCIKKEVKCVILHSKQRISNSKSVVGLLPGRYQADIKVALT